MTPWQKYRRNLYWATWSLLLDLDCWINALTGGDPQELLSSRFAKWRTYSWPLNYCGWVACYWLDVIDPGHAERYIQYDEGSDSILP